MEHNITPAEVLDVVSSIGYRILLYGGEINRAEDTVRRIGTAYGMDETHVFAIATNIIITIEKDGESLTKTCRIVSPTINLDKVDKYNALSRNICATLPEYAEILKNMDEIEKSPVYSKWIDLLGNALIGGAFAVFFGGGFYEFLTGFIVGAIVRLVLKFFKYLQSPPFFVNVAGGASTVCIIKLVSLIYPALDTSSTTIGVLMILVPGVLLTNCIRDFVATDYSAGTAKIMEALLIASAIALGVGVSVFWR